MKEHSGVTLVELLVTMGVASIVAALAVPSFTTLIQNNRMTTQLNEFVASLNYARTEAIRRGVTVTICPSSDGASCNTGAADKTWENGWIVFSNPDNDSTTIAADEILNVRQSLATGSTFRSGNPDFSYASTGFAVVGNDTVGMCDSRGAGHARAMIITTTGRVSPSDKDKDGNALTCP